VQGDILPGFQTLTGELLIARYVTPGWHPISNQQLAAARMNLLSLRRSLKDWIVVSFVNYHAVRLFLIIKLCKQQLNGAMSYSRITSEYYFAEFLSSLTALHWKLPKPSVLARKFAVTMCFPCLDD
jgi:hypothetical protein